MHVNSRTTSYHGCGGRAVVAGLLELTGSMETNYRAVVQQREGWWIGWIEEVPGVNSQGETREELLENLRSTLEEALEMNRADALSAAQGAPYEEVRVVLAA